MYYELDTLDKYTRLMAAWRRLDVYYREKLAWKEIGQITKAEAELEGKVLTRLVTISDLMYGLVKVKTVRVNS